MILEEGKSVWFPQIIQEYRLGVEGIGVGFPQMIKE